MIKSPFLVYKIVLIATISLWLNESIAQDRPTSPINNKKTSELLIGETGTKVSFWEKRNSDSFLFYIQKFRNLTKKYNSLNNISYYNLNMADYYNNHLNNYDSAIWYAKRNIQMVDSLNFFEQNTKVSYNTLSSAYARKQEYAKAYSYLKESYKKARVYPQVYSLNDSIILLASIQFLQLRMGMYENMKPYTEAFAKIIKENPQHPQVKGYGNMTLGFIYEQLKNDSFTVFLKRAHQFLIQESPNDYSFYHVVNTLAKTLLKRGQADSAYPYLQQFDRYYNLKRHYNLPKDQDFYLHYLEHVAHYHHLKRDYKKALQIIQPLYDSCKRYKNFDFIIHILPLMSEIYEKAGHIQEALVFSREYSTLNDSIYRNQLNAMYATQYQDQMSLLKDDIQVRDQHISLQGKMLKQRNALIFITILGLLVLGILVYTLKRNLSLKDKIKKEEFERLNSKHELEKLSSEIKGTEEERKRLAVDLHDGVANELWALQLQLNHFSDKLSGNYLYKTLLTQYQNLLTNVIDEVRNLAKNLRPSLLIQSGLATAIWSFCARMNSNQIKLKITCSIYEELPRFEEDIELSIYRIIQEIIQNAMKHATGANAINLQMTYSHQDLTISIEDNGCGMAADFIISKESNGLRNIYDRVKLLRGEITYISYPNVGTCFTLNFPHLHNSLKHV